MEDTLKKFKEQHLENYKSAILEIITNNTNVLVDEDIMSLVKKPPLDSMDVIKSKFLDVAKKNKVVLDEKICSLHSALSTRLVKRAFEKLKAFSYHTPFKIN